MTAPALPPATAKKRNSKSWKSEAYKQMAEVEFYKTQAEQAAANHRWRVTWLKVWAVVCALLGVFIGGWIGVMR